MGTVPDFKSRCWCITLWSLDDVHRFESLETTILVVGKETAPQTGREHYHVYVRFASPRSFHALHHQFPNAHLEPRRGTEAQAIEYCKKDGEVIVERCPPDVAVGVKKVYKPGEVEIECIRRLREGDTIRGLWADHPVYVARNFRMLRTVVRVLELWGHREDAMSVDNISGVEL